MATILMTSVEFMEPEFFIPWILAILIGMLLVPVLSSGKKGR